MGNILVGQSGGPTSVINASLYGVIKESLNNKDKINTIYGMINGVEGFLNGNYINISEKLTGENLELLKQTPSSFLGSCRYKLPKDITSPVYPKLFELFAQLDITYLLYIGGNDSMDTVAKLSNYAEKIGSKISIIGIPKTIDNDLVQTDHTPGFGSAAKFVAAVVRDISMDAAVYAMKSVTIVEIMGRNAGWLTATAVLARKCENDNPVLIYLPETPFLIEEFYHDLAKEFEKRDSVVICVSEGVKGPDGVFLSEGVSNTETDNFGHKRLTGCGKLFEDLVKARFDVKTRSVELNVTQRCVASMTSLTDVNEAIECAKFGVKMAIAGETTKMIGYVRENTKDYKISYTTVDVNEVCNKEKTIPTEWIIGNNNDLSDEFIKYVQPLIEGEQSPVFEKGLPKYCSLQDIL